MTAVEHARGHFPEGFRERLLGVLQTGATLLITRDSIRSSGTGTRLTVITAGEQ
jgi:hypothetical protein